MSGGRKKSSFQITSVTTDYEGPGSPGGSDPPALPAPTGPPPRLPNGEPNPEPGGRGTPRNGSPPPGAPASRFRVVKLPQGLGEPYRRGRWTCVDVYERDLEPPSFGRLLEGIRGASGGTGGRSLDSRLELASLGLSAPAPQPGLSQGPTSWLRPPPTSPGPQARSLTGGLGQLAVPSKAKVETPPLSVSPPQQRPPEPRTGDSTGTSRAATPLPSLRVEVEAGGSTAGTPPLPWTKDGALRLRMEETGQVRGGSQGWGGTPEGWRLSIRTWASASILTSLGSLVTCLSFQTAPLFSSCHLTCGSIPAPRLARVFSLRLCLPRILHFLCSLAFHVLPGAPVSMSGEPMSPLDREAVTTSLWPSPSVWVSLLQALRGRPQAGLASLGLWERSCWGWGEGQKVGLPP